MYINSEYKNIFTYHYISQDLLYIKQYLSKGIIFKFIAQLSDQSIYILGIKNEDNQKNVDFFKSKISNEELQYSFYYFYLTYLSWGLYSLKKYRLLFIKFFLKKNI